MNNNPKNIKSQEEIYRGDFCMKYVPRHNFKTFKEQAEMTEGELFQFMPRRIRALNDNFLEVKKVLAIAYWGADIAFVTFCHRINFVNRAFKNKWSMFAFKMFCVGCPLVFYQEVEKRAVMEHYARIYSKIEDDYRRYKNTGDILMLNPEVRVFDIEWAEDNSGEQGIKA